jgi:hypothetical protein
MAFRDLEIAFATLALGQASRRPDAIPQPGRRRPGVHFLNGHPGSLKFEGKLRLIEKHHCDGQGTAFWRRVSFLTTGRAVRKVVTPSVESAHLGPEPASCPDGPIALAKIRRFGEKTGHEDFCVEQERPVFNIEQIVINLLPDVRGSAAAFLGMSMVPIQKSGFECTAAQR